MLLFPNEILRAQRDLRDTHGLMDVEVQRRHLEGELYQNESIIVCAHTQSSILLSN